MSLGKNDKADFLISYTSVNEDIAEWIAWQLEEAGYRVVIQKWDFIPGSSFVREMRKALEIAHRMIAVISEAYYKSTYAMSEWDAAFAEDPDGTNRTLIPVRIENFDVSGLAKPRVYIDIVGCNEDKARQKLLDGVQGKRLKPSSPPAYPFPDQPADTQQAGRHTPRKPRPAMFSTDTESDDDVYVPPVRKTWTDQDKDVFLKGAFETMYDYFEKAKAALEREHSEIEVNLEQQTSRKFVCRLYMNGSKKNSCKIWISESYGHGQIGFSEGFAAESSNDNSYNEILTVREADNELFLSASMFTSIGATYGLDKDRLAPKQAGEYLWKRLTASLRY